MIITKTFHFVLGGNFCRIIKIQDSILLYSYAIQETIKWREKEDKLFSFERLNSLKLLCSQTQPSTRFHFLRPHSRRYIWAQLNYFVISKFISMYCCCAHFNFAWLPSSIYFSLLLMLHNVGMLIRKWRREKGKGNSRNRILSLSNEIEIVYFMIQIKYYRSNSVQTTTSFKILNNVAAYTLLDTWDKIWTMKWTNEDVSK